MKESSEKARNMKDKGTCTIRKLNINMKDNLEME